MQIDKLMKFGIAVSSLIVVGVGAVAIARADNPRPTQANIDYAKGTADLLQKEMIAALLQEFNETTVANAAQGKVAPSSGDRCAGIVTAPSSSSTA